MIDITNRRDLVRYLKSYEYLKHELDDIETSQLPRTPQISGDGSHSHTTSKSMSYAILIDKRDDIVNEMREISSVINCISDPITFNVLKRGDDNSEFISDEVADLLKRVKDQCEVEKRKYEGKK